MTTTEDLNALLERVKAATGPDWELDCAIALAIEFETTFNEETGECMVRFACREWRPLPPYTASIDAALALTERVLPGWRCDIHSPRFGAPFECILMDGDSASRKIVGGHGADAPLAIVAVTLQALISRVQP